MDEIELLDLDYEEWLALASPYDIAELQQEILHQEFYQYWGV